MTSIKARLESQLNWESVETAADPKLIKREKRHLWSKDEIYAFLTALQKEGWSDKIELTDEEFETLLANENLTSKLSKTCQSLDDFKVQFSDIIKYRGLHPSESLPIKNMYHVPVSDEEKELLKKALNEIPEGTLNRFTEILKKFDFHPARTTTDLRYVVRNSHKRLLKRKRKAIEKERNAKRVAIMNQKKTKEEKVDLS